MTKELDDLEKAEQSFFGEVMSLILYLNKNGLELSAVREMIDMKIERAFSEYPKLSKAYDKEKKQ
jgi:hypothetical protein